jgi:hypothetical protein
MPRPLYPRVRDPLFIVQKDGWAPGPIWTDAENLTLSGILALDRSPIVGCYTYYDTAPQFSTLLRMLPLPRRHSSVQKIAYDVTGQL